MNYGFVINNDDCIGCHACSTACKSENEVPLGVQRTWVKSVETGLYPNVQRNFQVTRCNHCENPPCVRICPVTAMYQRGDGIVEFDPDVCIGCKACMQACPYDAIYIDPESGTAAKCHYCAHRVDVGLEPACVVVCPEHAIIAGDMDDPSSEIARTIAQNKVTVRKPEQGTSPKLFYIGGDDVAMHPTAVERTPESFAWADVIPLHGGSGDGHSSSAPTLAEKSPGNARVRKSASGETLRAAAKQAHPPAGPIMIASGRMAEQMTQVVYNAQHKVPWHWQVPAYLVTKGIASGLFLIFAIGALFGLVAQEVTTMIAVGTTALVFLIATTALLVFDLERPERFLRIIFRPQWRSWLVRGAYILIGFSTLVGLWWAAEAGAGMGLIGGDLALSLRPTLLWLGIPLAIGTAIYTAFLFGQAEGRDLWQSPLLPIHLLVQATMSGAATVPLLALFLDLDPAFVELALTTLITSIGIDLAVTMLGEFGMPHASEQAAAAAHIITHGRYKNMYRFGNIGLGHVAPLVLLLLIPSTDLIAAAAGLSVLVGLYMYEHMFVLAPQEIPNS
jgi:Fe-S-cluster-containing dehydrogenase component/formate-dependent nitrite reductase membrane component NrfD